jgi:ABC-type histidine transport system ATPase subunit
MNAEEAGEKSAKGKTYMEKSACALQQRQAGSFPAAKHARIARALCMDPEVIALDETTSRWTRKWWRVLVVMQDLAER